jgi:alkylation response protein AidB-like acyl-CoA dehydrogenase
MKRLKLIKNQLSSNQSKTVTSAFDYLKFSSFLNKAERAYLTKFREYLNTHVHKQINEYIEKREFPKEIIKKILDNFPGLMGFSLKGYNSAGFSNWLSWCLLMQLASCDLSLATFFLVNGGELIMKVIDQFGNEDQRKNYLPKMNKLDIIGSYCLTEPEHGSDASNLKTNIKPTSDGNSYILNGKKRWIGNATVAGVLVVFARNSQNNKVEGYLVDPKSEGLTIKLIQGKYSTRSVHNCDIFFENVKVKKENKLENLIDFKDLSSQSLLGSRLAVAWLTIGAMIGTYDRIIEYCSNRKQFGKPLTSFQLIQEKIVRIMADTQSMLYFCKRCSELYLTGELTLGAVGMLKSWCTSRAREAIRLAREAFGGNGILLENWVMKTMLDLESLHTYEGTSDINILVCGKELTGINAIR